MKNESGLICTMKKQPGFSFYQNIANFEAFLWNFKLRMKRLFWRGVVSVFHSVVTLDTFGISICCTCHDYYISLVVLPLK